MKCFRINDIRHIDFMEDRHSLEIFRKGKNIKS